MECFARQAKTPIAHNHFRLGLNAKIWRAQMVVTTTGRGYPWFRGMVTGLMTTAGGLGHTLPFLISDFRIAMTAAVIVVACELAAISYIHHRCMDTRFLSVAFQVVVGGVVVFVAGMLIGSA
jgi:hypothetical protein